MLLADYFAIKAGLEDYFRPYSAQILPTNSTLVKITFNRGAWEDWSDYDIFVSAKNLARDNVDLQLGNVERDMQRMICQYKPNDVPDVLEMQYGGMERVYDRTNWASSNWASKTRLRVRYHHT